MPVQASAYVTVNPSFMEPELILPYSQASGAFDTLSGGKPRVRIAEDDLYVYMKRIDVRTKAAAGAAAYNQLPGVALQMSQIVSPTYLQRVRSDWNHHDVAAAGRWNVNLVEAYRLGHWQCHYQEARNALLYGYNPQNGEGLLNTSGATSINLPPDSNGNTTLSTYDNGQFGFFLAEQVLNVKMRTNQLGIGREFVILGPQRALGLFQYNIVQLVQFQRIGAGTESTAAMLKFILEQNMDRLVWCYDDTLIGQGNGGTDMIVIAMPEVEKPAGDALNTNIFATLSPGNPTCITMYADMAVPQERMGPLGAEATDFLTEYRITPGWAVRPDALTLLSAAYS